MTKHIICCKYMCDFSASRGRSGHVCACNDERGDKGKGERKDLED